MLIYVAHPYGGDENNKKRVEGIVECLSKKYTEHTFVSPIHAFGFMYSTLETYEHGMRMCLDLLDRCDCLIACLGWEFSYGATREVEHAKIKGLKIYDEKEVLLNWKF